jgi:hypothetical protein
MEAPTVIQQTQQQQQAQQPYRPRCVLNSPKAWLYELVTCPFLFKPCPQCSATNSGREVLITYFDTDNPTQGYCTYCPQRHMRPHLLQVGWGFCTGWLALLHVEVCLCVFVPAPGYCGCKDTALLGDGQSSTEHLQLVVSPSTGQIGGPCCQHSPKVT